MKRFTRLVISDCCYFRRTVQKYYCSNFSSYKKQCNNVKKNCFLGCFTTNRLFIQCQQTIPSHFLYSQQISFSNIRKVSQFIKPYEVKRNVCEEKKETRENVITIPNALCVIRIAVCPILGYLVLQEYYIASLGMLVAAGCTDIGDGYIARTFPSQRSMIGSFLDPAADKIFIATLFLTLTANGLIPVPLTALIIFRDACLMGAGFYVRYVSLPPPKTVSRYFDVSFATAQLAPTGISKLNTGIQISLVAATLAAIILGYEDHICLKILWFITGTTTVLSARSYMKYKDTYKLLLSTTRTKKSN